MRNWDDDLHTCHSVVPESRRAHLGAITTPIRDHRFLDGVEAGRVAFHSTNPAPATPSGPGWNVGFDSPLSPANPCGRIPTARGSRLRCGAFRGRQGECRTEGSRTVPGRHRRGARRRIRRILQRTPISCVCFTANGPSIHPVLREGTQRKRILRWSDRYKNAHETPILRGPCNVRWG